MDKASKGAGKSLEGTDVKSVSGKACAKAPRWTASGTFQEQGDLTGRNERMVTGDVAGNGTGRVLGAIVRTLAVPRAGQEAMEMF